MIPKSQPRLKQPVRSHKAKSMAEARTRVSWLLAMAVTRQRDPALQVGACGCSLGSRGRRAGASQPLLGPGESAAGDR